MALLFTAVTVIGGGVCGYGIYECSIALPWVVFLVRRPESTRSNEHFTYQNSPNISEATEASFAVSLTAKQRWSTYLCGAAPISDQVAYLLIPSSVRSVAVGVPGVPEVPRRGVPRRSPVGVPRVSRGLAVS